MLIILKGVCFMEVLKKYLDGGYKDNSHDVVKMKKVKKLNIVKNSKDSGVTINKELNGSLIKLRYIGNFKESKYCLNCRRELSQDNYLGIPVGMEKKQIKNIIDDVFVFFGSVCCIDCAYKFLEIINNSGDKKNIIFENSKYYLDVMCKKLGVKKIKNLPDYWHLTCFGGTMDYDTYHSGSIKLINTPNIEFLNIERIKIESHEYI